MSKIKWDKKNRSVTDDGGKPEVTDEKAAAALAQGCDKSGACALSPGMKTPK